MENNSEKSSEGSVWQSEPVRPRGPDVVLASWNVFELPRPGGAKRAKLFSGTNALDGHGKAGIPTENLDAAALRGVTESGRVYVLESSPGLKVNAACALDAFVRVNRAADIVDIGAEIKNRMGLM